MPSMTDSEWEDEMEVRNECEAVIRYEQGLCYPVCVGELLDQRYQIVHKLGWGGFAVVWLARDIVDDQLIAIKIMGPGDDGENELSIQNKLYRASADVSSLTLYRAAFRIRGVDDRCHLALVLPLRGSTLDNFTARQDRPRVERLSAAKTLLYALGSIHHAGIVHRDLNMGAILWELQPIDHWSTADIYGAVGNPRKVRLEEVIWKPGELVEQLQFPKDMLGPSVFLGDFGMSIKSGTSVSYTVQGHMEFCAPERYHGANPSYASDMWSYMCIFADLYLDFAIIYGKGSWAVDRTIGTLGPLPEEWKGSYCGAGQAQDWWYDQTGQRPLGPMHWETLEEKIDRMQPGISPSERALASSVLRRGLSYNPEDRLTATQLLADPDFTSLMGMYGL